jgi:hypothetical protein
MADDEIQTRVCRACGRDYEYPVLRSSATRFHCESCVRLDAATRETFEHFHKRIKELTRALSQAQSGATGSHAGKDKT